jgi:small subunit ribosomal protein S15
MAVSKTKKQEILKRFQRGTLDTGSPEVQVALLTASINEMSVHFGTHQKDNHSRRGLIKAVNRRRKLLDYLKRADAKRYQTIISDLDIRK